MYMYILKDQKELMLPIYIPGIDHTTTSGYYILMLIQLFIMFLGSFGLSACDIFYSLIFSNVPIMARLIEDEVNQLNEKLEKNSNETNHQFWTILMMHQRMTTYIRKFNTIFFKICFVQIATSMFSAILMSYIMITVEYNLIQ